MKKIFVLSSIFALFIFASSCKKEGQTIINNYSTDNSANNPQRKMIASWGAVNNSLTYSMTFKNNEIGKMEELIATNSGVANAKLIFIYNNDGKPTNYQIYSLPANVLSTQGILVTDNKKRITKIVGLELNADTNTILTFTYNDKDYQPTSYTRYYKSDDKIDTYIYYTYDNKDNVSKATSYRDNGTDPIYKSEEVEAVYSDIVNPINQMYYLMILQGNSISQAPINFSNYFPTSIKSQTFSKLGVSTGINFVVNTVETDADNNLSTINNQILVTYK